MITFDDVIIKETKEDNPNWPEIPDRPFRILIVGISESGKTNSLLNVTNYEPDIDKIYLHAKDPCEKNYQLLIKKRESTCLNYLNDSKVFTEFSKDMDDAYTNIEEHNPNRKQKILIVFK